MVQSAELSSNSRTHSEDHQKMQVKFPIPASMPYVDLFLYCTNFPQDWLSKGGALQASMPHKKGTIIALTMWSITSITWECLPPRYAGLTGNSNAGCFSETAAVH